MTVNPATLPANAQETFDLDGIATANTANRMLALGQAATDVDFGYDVPADLTITKTDGNLTYTAGTAISYAITATNVGPAAVTGAS